MGEFGEGDEFFYDVFDGLVDFGLFGVGGFDFVFDGNEFVMEIVFIDFLVDDYE